MSCLPVGLDVSVVQVVKEKMPLLWDVFWKRQQQVPLKVRPATVNNQQTMISGWGGGCGVDVLTQRSDWSVGGRVGLCGQVIASALLSKQSVPLSSEAVSRTGPTRKGEDRRGC